MNSTYKRYPSLLFFLISLLSYSLYATEPGNRKNQYNVRVLLDSHNAQDDSWKLNCPGGFILYDRSDITKKYTINDPMLTISYTARGIVCNNRPYTTDCLVIMPRYKQTTIGYLDNHYQGIFLVVRSKEKVLLINRLELEDYIFSVLKTESFPGWPLEVNKVFAIACRTYALAMILSSSKTSLPYHIRNTNHHQTYTGIHKHEQLRKATRDTEGIFISHNEKPILAMFDICCGGIIPAHVSGFDFIKSPYLARPYPCDFCKRSKMYEWQISYPKEQLRTLLAPEIKKIQVIRDITMTKDKAGLVHKVTIHGKKTQVTITGRRLRTLIKEIRSHCFAISKNSSEIIFQGRGYGHHIGICQWGVREMVRDGHDCYSILRFYYPQTTCMRLRYG